jgi:murein DD-endopeptidase MepM/ murein hydrolase activator NlpD
MRLFLIAGVLIVLIGAPAALFFLSTQTQVELQPAGKSLGPETAVGVTATNPHGVRRVTVEVLQGQARVAASADEPPTRWMFWRKKAAPKTYTLKPGTGAPQGFKSGPAQLIVTAVSNDLRRQETRITQDVVINLAPPKLQVDGEQHYINQGGAELVTFTVGGYWTEAGIRVGNYSFRSFRMPGSKDDSNRFCLFGFPWDVSADTIPVVYAKNDAGQEVTARFWTKITAKQFRKRELEIRDDFIEKVVNELDAGGAGSPLDRFLKVNGEMRRANNKALADLRLKSEEKFLWKPPFKQLTNSKVEAHFADVRTYTYEKKKVDEQVHLGFDLSKTKNSPVEASNDGKIVWAAALGIYGNCVVVDHGYGLQSIYGHLSSIEVKPGQAVTKGQELGLSGATGMAGGDHLHYSMQIDGVQVNAVEWWDPHWIKDRIASKVPVQ